jgi:hypothetical protein
LTSSRVRNEREFFTISPKDAAQKILNTAATHNIEIFFHKFDSSISIQVSEPVNSDELFELYEKEFFDALITLDSRLIYKKWEMYSGYYDVENSFCFQTEIDSKYKTNFDLYLKKIAFLGNDELDNLFLNELPTMLKGLGDLECYEMFYHAYSLLRIEKTAHKIALEYFRRAKDTSDLIIAAKFLYLVGLEEEAYNLYCENLLPYCENINYRWFAREGVPLFIFTAISLDNYSRTKSLPIDSYYKSIDMFYSNVDVLNNKIKKEEWLGDAERFYKEVYKWESPDPWKSNWMEIAELTKIAVTKIDSVSSKDYKKILTDYLRNIFFYTSCKK